MRVCCLIDSLVSGGGQRQLVNLAILLKQRGHDIDFVVYRQNDFYKHLLDENGISITFIKHKNNIDRIIKVRKYLKHYTGDVVISFLETPNFLACISAVGKHSWKLVTNELSAKESSFHGGKSKIFKWFERFSDWTVCNSLNAQHMWERYYPRYSNRISTIYNPISIPEKLHTTPLSNVKNKRVIVVAASYQYLKNPIKLIEAINLLSDAEKSHIIVEWYGRKEVESGNTKAYDEALQLVEKYSLNQVIHLNEETQNIYDKMNAADAIGLFSIVEGLPNAVCEGMMLGKPIVMSTVSDFEFLASSGGIILCDPLNTSSIAAALQKFIETDSTEITRMGDSNRIFAKRFFSEENIYHKWMKLFHGLLS